MPCVFVAGVFKDILLITSSTLFFGSKISPLQIFGEFLGSSPVDPLIILT